MIVIEYLANCHEEIFTLEADFVGGSLKLTMKVRKNRIKTEIFEATIKSLKEFGFLEKFCESF